LCVSSTATRKYDDAGVAHENDVYVVGDSVWCAWMAPPRRSGGAVMLVPPAEIDQPLPPGLSQNPGELSVLIQNQGETPEIMPPGQKGNAGGWRSPSNSVNWIFTRTTQTTHYVITGDVTEGPSLLYCWLSGERASPRSAFPFPCFPRSSSI